MSDDPETLRQIEELAADDRPLLVLDVDDVVLEFIRQFAPHLDRRDVARALAGDDEPVEWPKAPHWRERAVALPDAA